jgi:hypothetical protein
MFAGWDWTRRRTGETLLLLLDGVNGGEQRMWGPVCDMQSLLRAVAGLEDAMLGVSTSQRLRVGHIKTAARDVLHLYAEDCMWLFGEAAIDVLALPAYTMNASMASNLADGIIQQRTLLPPKHMVDLWHHLQSPSTSMPGDVKHAVWAMRIASLVLDSLTKVLRVLLAQSTSQPTIVFSNLVEMHKAWSFVCDQGLRPYVIGNSLLLAVGSFVATRDTRCNTWHTMCRDALEAVAAWDTLGHKLRERVRREAQERLARVNAQQQTGCK